MPPGEEAPPPPPSSPFTTSAAARRKIRTSLTDYYRHLTSGAFLFEIKRLTILLRYRLPSAVARSATNINGKKIGKKCKFLRNTWDNILHVLGAHAPSTIFQILSALLMVRIPMCVCVCARACVCVMDWWRARSVPDALCYYVAGDEKYFTAL